MAETQCKPDCRIPTVHEGPCYTSSDELAQQALSKIVKIATKNGNGGSRGAEFTAIYNLALPLLERPVATPTEGETVDGWQRSTTAQKLSPSSKAIPSFLSHSSNSRRREAARIFHSRFPGAPSSSQSASSPLLGCWTGPAIVGQSGWSSCGRSQRVQRITLHLPVEHGGHHSHRGQHRWAHTSRASSGLRHSLRARLA